MKKTILTFLLYVGIIMGAFAQNSTIHGLITDTSEKKNLANSVIAVMRKSDSVMVSFTRSDKSGNFTLRQVPSGKSFIMITYPSYADFIDNIDVTGADLDMGKIFMTLKSQLLQEVIVSNNGAIRVKGDTTEFKADSFHVKPGATVEDLLKKIPGIQVDKNGKITAQGEAVQKVLVDGEEFFSDDPTIVTQNMDAAAIDKVQVYDKKSDQATFTGIDDGQKLKTIDLKLKANRKHGYFGKVELGTDANKFWNNSAMLNAFKNKRKFAAFGIMSNTGKTGLDWQESTNYGSNSEATYDEASGGMYIMGNGDDFGGGSYYGEGRPKVWNAGALYSNKWDNDRKNLNSSYQYKKLNTASSGSTLSKYILPDTLYYINEKGNSYSSKYRNTINGTYEHQLDSSSSLKITARDYTGKSNTLNNTYTESLDKSGNFVNSSNRKTSSLADEQGLNSTLLYRKKFKKQGRTFSLNVNQTYTETKSDGYLNADYKYYNENGTIKKEETTDQQKVRANIQSSVSSRVIYTEPLSKRAILEFNYSLANSHGHSSIGTFGKMQSSSNKYEDLIDSLSNNYSLNVLTNSGGINYRYAKVKKINLSVGGNIARADYARRDVKVDTAVNYHFINLFPRASVNWTLAGGNNLNFNYNGNTQAPSIDQIQPIKDNSDLLNQRIGNPNLKQAFRQRFNLSLNNYKLLSQRSMYVSMNVSTVQNDFSTINYVDALGKRISQPVNVQGNRSMGGYAYYSIKLKKPEVRAGFNLSLNNNRNTNFINTLKNINNSVNFTFGPNINFEKGKKFDISFQTGFTRTRSTSSIRPDEPTKYWTQSHYVYGTFFLPWKIQLNTDCNFNIRQKTDAFDKNNNAIKWNASIDRKFLKKNAATLRFSANDILDQNLGFSRSVNSNFIFERTYDNIRRYFMLSVIYNFNKNGTPQSF